MARLIVSGWRAARPDRHGQIVADALREWAVTVHTRDLAATLTLVHGACHLGGVDTIAADIAARWGWTVEPHPAQNHPTQDFGPWPGAGPRRNAYMCSLGADMVIALPGPGSTGTWQCLHEARRYGIPFRGYPLQTAPTRGGR